MSKLVSVKTDGSLNISIETAVIIGWQADRT